MVNDQISLQNPTLQEPDLLTSLRQKNDPLGWPKDNDVWRAVQSIGFGKIYLHPDPGKIRPKEQITKKVSEIQTPKPGVPLRSYLISGPVGTGKTTILCHLAYHCCREFCRPNYSLYARSLDGFHAFAGFQWSWPDAAFISTGDLFDLFFDRVREKTESLKRMGYLFLDDFGREYQTEFPLSKFENWIEYRYANLLPTFITTNISPGDLADRENWGRIVDRFRDPKWMDILTISGKSMRGEYAK